MEENSSASPGYWPDLAAVQNHVPGPVPSRLQELHRMVSVLVGPPALCGALRAAGNANEGINSCASGVFESHRCCLLMASFHSSFCLS